MAYIYVPNPKKFNGVPLEEFCECASHRYKNHFYVDETCDECEGRGGNSYR